MTSSASSLSLRTRLGLALVLVLAVGVFLALGGARWFSLEVLRAQLEGFQAWRAQAPWTVAAGYFGVYVGVTALSLPGATGLTLLGGALFGFWQGLVLVSFASSLGATLAAAASRHLLRDAVLARLGPRLEPVLQGVDRDGAFYLLSLRLVPLVPFFVINLAMGLTRLPLRTFYGVSQLGMLPGTVVYVNAGTQLAQLESASGLLSPGLLGAFALLAVFPWLARGLMRGLQQRRALAPWAAQRPRHFDRNLVVIGAGAAGLVASYVAATVKARVTLVERHQMGGDCLNTGCVPSKALIRAAHAVHAARAARALGLTVEGRPDVAAVRRAVHAAVEDIAPHDSVERYRSLGVDVQIGEARLLDPWRVQITGPDGQAQTLSTRAIVIATGARPTVPPLPGLEAAGYRTSETLWDLQALPERLVVLGGGPIGCELAQAFARLGSAVSLVEMAPRLLLREDEEVGRAVADALQDDGVDLRLGHAALRCKGRAGQGDSRLVVRDAEGREHALPYDTLLVAVGRNARLNGHGLEDLGLAMDRTLKVDEHLQTRIAHILAAGDVAGPWQLTHAAAHQAWTAAVNALFGFAWRFKVDARVIPAVTFVAPEVARVGLNEQEARQQGVPHEVTRFELGELDRVIIEHARAPGRAGWVKVLTTPGRDRILGVTLVGEHAGELLAEWTLAMRHGLGLNQVLGTVHPYPTRAESSKYTAGVWKRAHAPERLLRWIERLHDWRRG